MRLFGRKNGTADLDASPDDMYARGYQGGFNWSSQHLDYSEVSGGVWEAAVGGSWLSGTDSLTGATDGGVA